MKGAVFVIFHLCIFVIQCRLIGKSENKTDVEDKKSTITQRANRDTSDGRSLVELSKFGTKINYTTEQNIMKDKNIYANDTVNEPPEAKKELVKRPIPKFNDINYDDDFDSEIFLSKLPLSSLNEIDHEDEDFDLDDYDFDVNHDEFAGRGKPLEPRKKVKDVRETQNRSPNHASKSQNMIKTDSEKESKTQNIDSTPKNEQQPTKIKGTTPEKTVKLQDNYDFTGENFGRVGASLKA